MAVITSFACSTSATRSLKIDNLKGKLKKKSTCKSPQLILLHQFFCTPPQSCIWFPLFLIPVRPRNRGTRQPGGDHSRSLELGALCSWKSPTWRLRQPKAMHLPGLLSSAVIRTYLVRLRASFFNDRPPLLLAPTKPKQAPEASPLYCHSLYWSPRFLVTAEFMTPSPII
jgi:hypothetical protein